MYIVSPKRNYYLHSLGFYCMKGNKHMNEEELKQKEQELKDKETDLTAKEEALKQREEVLKESKDSFEYYKNNFGYFINDDCLSFMRKLDDCCVDLTVTSPPYDNLRKYNGYYFDFENIAKEPFGLS